MLGDAHDERCSMPFERDDNVGRVMSSNLAAGRGGPSLKGGEGTDT